MAEIIRCFLAIDLPQDIKDAISNYIDQLKDIYPDLKWVRSGALHITLKFLGNQPAETVNKIVASLTQMTPPADPFYLEISGFGAFPNEKRARVFWLNAKAERLSELRSLHQWLENHLTAYGFEKEKRAFSPHLTIARVKKPGIFQPLFEYAGANPFSPMRFEVNEIVLMRSFLKPGGAEYRPIQKYPLLKK